MKGKSKDSLKASNRLSFPDVVSYDHLKNCPRYTSSKDINFLKLSLIIFDWYIISIMHFKNRLKIKKIENKKMRSFLIYPSLNN